MMSDTTENTPVEKKEYSQLTATELAAIIADENTPESEKEKIADEIIKHIGVKVGALTLLTSTRFLKMKKVFKAIVEEDGEVYKLELKKVTDITPEKGVRPHDADISQTLSITIEVFE